MSEPTQPTEAACGRSDSTEVLGLTHVDFFAAHALTGLMLLPDEQWKFDFSDCRGGEETWSDHIAMAAYSIAEAMLRARKHKMFATPNGQGNGLAATNQTKETE